jgi:hypothetical protein
MIEAIGRRTGAAKSPQRRTLAFEVSRRAGLAACRETSNVCLCSAEDTTIQWRRQCFRFSPLKMEGVPASRASVGMLDSVQAPLA